MAAPSVPSGARAGDIIAIGSDSFWSELAASFSARDRRFGHVGVLVDNGGERFVVDAGAMGLSGHAGVTVRPLASFLAGAERAVVFRPMLPPAQQQRFLSLLMQDARRHLAFDEAFDLATDDAVYCTELIWRALSGAVGDDAVPAKSRIAGRDVITVEDLLSAPLLCPLAMDEGPSLCATITEGAAP